MSLDKYLIIMMKQELEALDNADDVSVRTAIFNRFKGFVSDYQKYVIK